MGSRFESRDDLAESASSEDELSRPFSDGSDQRRRMSNDDHRSVQSGTPDLTGVMSEVSRPPLEPPFSPSRPRRRYSYNEEDETTALDGAEGPSAKPVSWRSLPKKGQLAIITVARLAEPLAQTSLQAYMFHQVKSFDPSLPDSTVSTQAGILQGCFTAAQFATGVIWGRLADTEFFGRKRVLLIGLFGACLSSVGFGLSKSFAAAVVFRILGGALNSNAGVMRAMIAEIIEGKEYQSRAFLLLPMCFNTGMILGPILGGILADPVKNYPGLFGPGSLIGGKDGVWWMKQWPYALPNFISALFMLIALVAVFLGLDEVISRTFSIPATVILVNNSVPDPSVLATVHGVAQSVACGARAVGPLLAGWGLGLGLKNNIVGGVWWALALIAILNWALTWTIFEGNTEKGKGDKTHHSPSQ
ncbi:hypothetical protein CIHG_01998 [Coccidioides immitis H538.4]|uniref:Major facilitator superfamily (MFS) profile domain-containing protein n=1 Tax=Coccidioides immitis H538.4 TaxID=396776 RepID=A0A0J8RH56_COCIT|nr:hypothetical protein CIHG_01998 [Coccidioides immitis H538.4]